MSTTSTEPAEPQGSERSSTDRCRNCGQPIKPDPTGWFHTRFARMPCTKPAPECQHPDNDPCDHSRCGWKPRGEEHEGCECQNWPEDERCSWHKKPEQKPKPCTCGPDEACGDDCEYEPRCEGCGHTDAEGCGCPPEPPMTPEEEGEAPPDEACTCGDAGDAFVPLGHYKDCPQTEPLPPSEGPEYTPCTCGHTEPEHSEVLGRPCYGAGCECTSYRTKPDFELPPQPDRRPPYAVIYSVQGHPYQVALPGDATVSAVDGALVIQHALGPVAGIVQVLPVVNGESA